MYPIKLCCVIENDSNSGAYNKIREVQEYASKAGISFYTRLFDPKKYSDDQREIKSLPAFHLYIERSYFRTIYPDIIAINHINECITNYRFSIQEKVKRKEKWNKIISVIVPWLAPKRNPMTSSS